MFDAISVSRYNTYIKQIFDAEELLHNIKIIGEVFGVSFSRQVIYFSLKDENSSISCVCFYNDFLPLLKEGDSVIITGSPNYYVKAGKLSFNVFNVEKAGEGVLYQQFMLMKEKLEKEGLFDTKHKKQLPKSIKRIGVITSKEGAVIHDIINIATRRNPFVDIILFPCKVQGKGAEDEIAYNIKRFDEYENIDVIVVARGGGSLEDLWAYNTEKVARAVFECKKPIISAVGHETDFTICDFVADLRAPTPSAAAELLTIDVGEKSKNLNNMISRLKTVSLSFLKTKEEQINSMISNLIYLFTNLEKENRFKLEKNIISFQKTADEFLNSRTHQLSLIENSLQALSPLDVLKRGYAKIEQDGKAVDNVKDVVISSDLKINFYDGIIVAKPKSVEERK